MNEFEVLKERITRLLRQYDTAAPAGQIAAGSRSSDKATSREWSTCWKRRRA
ncbi:hypothetical protein [Planotetraspora sp. GP83]|uniref:hypothetical protein n=1 Tax=Planotetraspora sp. GP83 TaxID=3156264 RepID=UPI003512632E